MGVISRSTSDQPAVLRGLTDRVVGPHRDLEETAFPQSPSNVVNNPVLRDDVRGLLTESLDDRTLLGLLGR